MGVDISVDSNVEQRNENAKALSKNMIRSVIRFFILRVQRYKKSGNAVGGMRYVEGSRL